MVARGARNGVDNAVESASISGIPAAALAAYQRAETVINAADKSCNISWQLIAAIGRVESDHGRANGNTLNDRGPRHARHLRHPARRQQQHRRHPRHRRRPVRLRREVGPRRRPDAVHPVDLVRRRRRRRQRRQAQPAGHRRRRPRHRRLPLLRQRRPRRPRPASAPRSSATTTADDYVDLVLSIMDAYLDGDFTSVPNDDRRLAGYVRPRPRAGPVHPADGPPAATDSAARRRRRGRAGDPSGTPAGSHGGGNGPPTPSRTDPTTPTTARPSPRDPAAARAATCPSPRRPGGAGTVAAGTVEAAAPTCGSPTPAPSPAADHVRGAGERAVPDHSHLPTPASTQPSSSTSRRSDLLSRLTPSVHRRPGLRPVARGRRLGRAQRSSRAASAAQ